MGVHHTLLIPQVQHGHQDTWKGDPYHTSAALVPMTGGQGCEVVPYHAMVYLC